MTLTFDRLTTLKVVPGSRVTWTISVPILVFLGLSVLELGPMYATDRQTSDVRQKHRLMHPPYGGRGITKSRAQTSMKAADATKIVNLAPWRIQGINPTDTVRQRDLTTPPPAGKVAAAQEN